MPAIQATGSQSSWFTIILAAALVADGRTEEETSQAAGAASPQASREVPAQHESVMPSTTYQEAIEVGKRSMDDLDTLRDAYQSQFDADKQVAETMYGVTRNLSLIQARRSRIDLSIFKFKSIVVRTIKDQLGETARIHDANTAAELTARARSYADEAAKLSVSLSAIKRAINDLNKRAVQK